ncbi:MAG TPA: ArsC family reductase [Roseiarcus sp.]|nr:ArsC family reductase [Roseiarcus sp.]
MAARKKIVIYGIKNCDTMTKARKWLDSRGASYAFHDYRVEGLERALLKDWAKALGWEKLLNKSSATFRALPDAAKQGLTEAKALALMIENPTAIKRPVLDVGGKLLVGFKEEAYEAAIP